MRAAGGVRAGVPRLGGAVVADERGHAVQRLQPLAGREGGHGGHLRDRAQALQHAAHHDVLAVQRGHRARACRAARGAARQPPRSPPNPQPRGPSLTSCARQQDMLKFLARLAAVKPLPAKHHERAKWARSAAERETVLGVRDCTRPATSGGLQFRPDPSARKCLYHRRHWRETTGCARRARPPVAWAPAVAARLW